MPFIFKWGIEVKNQGTHLDCPRYFAPLYHLFIYLYPPVSANLSLVLVVKKNDQRLTHTNKRIESSALHPMSASLPFVG
ncbi:MAG: hypothetical protein H2069_08255 [Legionella sp.]|nr:hypothetical protein [Legionella sp.]